MKKSFYVDVSSVNPDIISSLLRGFRRNLKGIRIWMQKVCNCGEPVKKEVGGDYSGIPPIVPPDGIFITGSLDSKKVIKDRDGFSDGVSFDSSGRRESFLSHIYWEKRQIREKNREFDGLGIA